MGCEGIQLKLNTMEVNITTLLHPIQVRAKFYLFRPQVGAELMCVITKMEEAGIRCLAHGMFEVKVFGPLGCSEMAWQEPKILASLVEVCGNNDAPLVEIVILDNLGGEYFEDVQNSVSNDELGVGRERYKQ